MAIEFVDQSAEHGLKIYSFSSCKRLPNMMALGETWGHHAPIVVQEFLKGRKLVLY